MKEQVKISEIVPVGDSGYDIHLEDGRVLFNARLTAIDYDEGVAMGEALTVDFGVIIEESPKNPTREDFNLGLQMYENGGVWYDKNSPPPVFADEICRYMISYGEVSAREHYGFPEEADETLRMMDGQI